MTFAVTTCAATFMAALAVATWLQTSKRWTEESQHLQALEAMKANPGSADNQALLERALQTVADLDPIRIPAPAAPENPPTLEAPPSDWDQFPRTDFRLASTLQNKSDLIGERLFRNTHLNPTDEPIPSAERLAFSSWLSHSADALHDLRTAITHVANQELDFMIQKGLARTLSYSAYVSALPAKERDTIETAKSSTAEALRAAGASEDEIAATLRDLKSFDSNAAGRSFCYATRENDDFIYLGDLARMPQTLDAASAYSASCLMLYSQIVNFFQAHCGLPESAANQAVQDIEKALTAYRP